MRGLLLDFNHGVGIKGAALHRRFVQDLDPIANAGGIAFKYGLAQGRTLDPAERVRLAAGVILLKARFPHKFRCRNFTADADIGRPFAFTKVRSIHEKMRLRRFAFGLNFPTSSGQGCNARNAGRDTG